MLSAASGHLRTYRGVAIAAACTFVVTLAAASALGFAIAGSRLIPKNVGYQSVVAGNNAQGITLGSVTLASGGGSGSPYWFFFQTPSTVGPWYVSGSGVTHARALSTTSAVLWVDNNDPQGRNGFYNGYLSGPG